MLKRADTYRIISSNNYVINIKKNKSDTSRGSLDEENSVMRTQSETLLNNNWAKRFKLSPKSQLEAIQSMVKTTNLTAWVSIARRGKMGRSSWVNQVCRSNGLWVIFKWVNQVVGWVDPYFSNKFFFFFFNYKNKSMTTC